MKFLRSIFDFLFWAEIERAREEAERHGEGYVPSWQFGVIGLALAIGLLLGVRALMGN